MKHAPTYSESASSSSVAFRIASPGKDPHWWLVQAIKESNGEELGYNSPASINFHIEEKPKYIGSTLIEGVVVIPTQSIDDEEKRIQDVREALNKGEYGVAQRLATKAVADYPCNENLQKMAEILAPPKSRISNAASDSWSKNRSWLRLNWDEYYGKWVALKDGELLGTSSRLQTLAEKFEKDEDILFTLVN